MKLLLSCLLGLFVHETFAQPYKPMLTQFNEWHVTNCSNSCLTDVYYTYKDTSFNGNTYHVLDGYHYISGTFLLREDVVQKKVYMHLITGSKEGLEYLLYDFSLQPGDSVEVHNPISPYPTDAGYFLLDSIATIMHVDGDNYRHFYLTSLDTSQSLSPGAEWIEGIGSTSLINTPGAQADFDQAGNLSCFFNNQTLHYSDLDSIDQCIQVNTDLGLNTQIQFQLKVFPNPANNSVTITLPSTFNGWLSVQSMSGKEVFLKKIHLEKELILDLTSFEEGCYILHVQSIDGQRYSEKIMVY